MAALLLFALLAPAGSAEAAMAAGRALTRATPPPCVQSAGEIVVCGRRTDPDRYRLPLPDERLSAEGAPPPRGERPAASAANVRQGGCGIALQGQRCSSGLSAARMGEALLRAARTLVDPDAIAEPDDFRAREKRSSRHPDSTLSPH